MVIDEINEIYLRQMQKNIKLISKGKYCYVHDKDS